MMPVISAFLAAPCYKSLLYLAQAVWVPCSFCATLPYCALHRHLFRY